MFKKLFLLSFSLLFSMSAYAVDADTDPLKWRQLVEAGEIGNTEDTVYGWFAGFNTRMCVATYEFQFNPKIEVTVNKCGIVVQPLKTLIEKRLLKGAQGREFFNRP